MRNRFVWFFCLAFLFSACKIKFFSPSEGRVLRNADGGTLFDHLIALAPEGKVPLPFSELVTYLAQYGEPHGVLIPLGRSQQRKAGYPNPFADPRRIVGFGASPATAQAQDLYLNLFKNLQLPTTAFFDIDARLFLAYTEKACQIEVLSLLPHSTQFDFQLVDVCPADKPRVRTADSKECLSCHQQGGPLLSEYGFDSNNDPKIRLLLSRHHPQGNVDGIAVQMATSSDDGELIPNDYFSLQVMINSQAKDIMNDNLLWAGGCINLDKIKCREAAIKYHYQDLYGGVPRYKETLRAKLIATEPIDDYLPGPNSYDDWLDAAHLKGYVPSVAADRIYARIKTTDKSSFAIPATVNDRESWDKVVLLAFFMSAIKANKNDSFTMPQGSPPLRADEFETIAVEVEKILIHIHGQDLHLGTEYDFAQPRKVWEVTDYAFLSSGFSEEIQKLFKLTLLPANRKPQLAYLKLDSSLLVTLQADTVSLRSRRSFESIAPNTHIRYTSKYNRDTCTETDKEIKCIFNNFNPMYGEEHKITNIKFHFYSNKIRGHTAPTASLSFTHKGQAYTIALVCRNTHQKNKLHECTPYDIWPVGDAIEKLVTDKNSPLHHDYFDPVSIDRYIVQQMEGH